MKKTFSISDNVVLRLEQVAKENNSTQSKIVETALIIYMMIQHGAPDQTKMLSDMIPKNQLSLFEVLDSVKK